MTRAARSKVSRGSEKPATAKRWKKPSYETPMAFARFALELVNHPLGVAEDELEARLGVEARAIQRYLAIWEEYRKDGLSRRVRGKAARIGEKAPPRRIRWADQPRIETVTYENDHGVKRRWIRFAVKRNPTDATAYEVASLAFMLTLLHFLEGTVVRDGLEALVERLRETISERRADVLRDLDKKFHSITIGAKAYAGFDAILDDVLIALLYQRRLRIEYRNVDGEESVHEFAPYTLVAYRGGLYLLGRSHRYEDLRYLAIERIRKLEPARTADGGYDLFAYPRDYDPAARMDGLFGIVEGRRTKVVLLLRNATTVELLRPRSIHPTAKYEMRPDGSAIVRMTVNGTAELVNWVLSHSPWVEILEPASLREEIAKRARETARLYGAAKRPARAWGGLP